MNARTEPSNHNIPWAVQWLTSPLLLAGNLALALTAIAQGWDFKAILGIANVAVVVIAILVESLYPMSPEWRMTRRSFHRDLKYLVVSVASIAATESLFGLVSISLNTGHSGPLTRLPLYAAVPIGLFAVDFIQYWLHRWSHEARCAISRFLWRSHVAHHLSDKVYVLMHPASHPINWLLVRGVAQILPLYLLGVSPAAVLLISLIIATQGILSHCNADLRAGWFNYVLTGTELHRYHHSADVDEAQNFAVSLPVIDMIFGTFRYRPGVAPVRLGVDRPDHYPESYDVIRVLLLPFHPGRRQVRLMR